MMFHSHINWSVILTVTCILISSCITHEKKPVTISWKNLRTAQSDVKVNKNKVMVMISIPGCKYCEKIEENVFPDSIVISTINSHYEAVRINAKSDILLEFNGIMVTEREFAELFGINSYPTILFFDYDGELIVQINGYMPVSDFNKMLTYIGTEAYISTGFYDFTVN